MRKEQDSGSKTIRAIIEEQPRPAKRSTSWSPEYIQKLRDDRDRLLRVAEQVAWKYEHEQLRSADPASWTISHELGQSARAAVRLAKG